MIPCIIPASQEARADTPPPSYVFRRSWGGEGSEIIYPTELAVSKDGTRLYVDNRDGSTITILRLTDQTFSLFGGYGAGDGQFKWIGGIAVDYEGYVYVSDGNNNTVQKFTPDGKFLLKWGSQGSSDGQFLSPRGIAVDRSGIVFVVDEGNNRIQKFSTNGAFLSTWGVQGRGAGQLYYPEGIAIDNNGGVYVSGFNGPIQKFTSDGVYISGWNTNFKFPFFPQWLAVDGSGNILASEIMACQVQKFAPTGTYISSWNMIGPGPYPDNCFAGLAVDGQGKVYVSNNTNNRIDQLMPDGTVQTAWQKATWQYSGAGGIAVDKDNNVYITGRYHVLKFSPDGAFLTQWGSNGYGDGQFDSSSGIAIDKNDNVYVADPSLRRIQKFKTDGTFLTKFVSPPSGGGQFYAPMDMAVDGEGNLYVIDGGTRVLKFSPDGTILAQFGSYGTGEGQIFNALGIAVDTSGNIFVADNYTSRVLKFAANGQFLVQWGNQGSGDALLNRPEGIAVDSNGLVFVVDSDNQCVKVFSPEGTFLTKWGTFGLGPGQFVYPVKIALDSQNNVYINGSPYSFSYLKFSSGLPPSDPVSGLVENGTFEAGRPLAGWDYGGILPVTRSSSNTTEGNYSLQLGIPVAAIAQGASEAWANTTFFIPQDWTNPTLSFQYHIMTNDIQANADFFVEVQDAKGYNHLATLLDGGYTPCSVGQPSTGVDLGWQNANFNLNAYKGQFIRLVFSARNLTQGSLGIWANVDNVKVLDMPIILPPPASVHLFFPFVSSRKCQDILSPNFR